MSALVKVTSPLLVAAFLAGCATAPATTSSGTSSGQAASTMPAAADDADARTDRIAFFVHHARNGECDEVFKEIDAGLPIDSVDPLDQTALVAAISQQHEDCAQKLLDRGASVATRDPAGWTPLIFATYFGASPILIDQLIKHGADVNAQNDRGITALHLAAGAGNEPLVALLLVRGANRDLATKSGYTPLRLAQTKGLKRITEILETPLPNTAGVPAAAPAAPVAQSSAPGPTASAAPGTPPRVATP